MADNYCTIEQAKTAIPDEDWGSKYDALFTFYVAAASRAIDLYCHRPPGFFSASADQTRYYTGDNSDKLWIDPLAAAPTSVSELASDGETYTALASTDYRMWPTNALLEGKPYIRIDMAESHEAWSSEPLAVKVIGKFGWSTTVPEVIRHCAVIQSMRWFKRGQQAFQDVGAIAELGQLQFVQALDPDIAAILPAYRAVYV